MKRKSHLNKHVLNFVLILAVSDIDKLPQQGGFVSRRHCLKILSSQLTTSEFGTCLNFTFHECVTYFHNIWSVENVWSMCLYACV